MLRSMAPLTLVVLSLTAGSLSHAGGPQRGADVEPLSTSPSLDEALQCTPGAWVSTQVELVAAPGVGGLVPVYFDGDEGFAGVEVVELSVVDWGDAEGLRLEGPTRALELSRGPVARDLWVEEGSRIWVEEGSRIWVEEGSRLTPELVWRVEGGSRTLPIVELSGWCGAWGAAG